MPLEFTGIKKGIEIDFDFQLTGGSALPWDNSAIDLATTVGAIYGFTDASDSSLYQKTAAGIGEDKWQKIALIGTDLDVEYAKRYDEPSSGGGFPKVAYFGRAAPGALNSASSWLIQEISELNNQGDLEIKYANGVALFDKAWDDRTGLTYT
jgi:hypothetical protein